MIAYLQELFDLLAKNVVTTHGYRRKKVVQQNVLTK